MMTSFKTWSVVLAVGSAFVAACSAGVDATSRNNGGGSASGGSGTTPIGMGGGINVGTPGMVDPNDKRDLEVRKKVCDANNTNCTCLRLALLGTLQSAAADTDTQPFINWLNGNSDGTATVTMVSTKPTLNADFLAKYDILVVANVSGWSFGADEKAAVEKWVREKGGGIITLTGFVSTDAEPAASGQLIEFAGFKYQPPQTAPASGEAVPVYYKGGTVDLKKCLHWSQSTTSHITSPIKFTPQTGALSKLTLNLDYVGAFIGWSVSPPGGATILAKDPVTNNTMAAAYEVDGKGRIFAFGDEWVIFANQWVPRGNPDNQQMDQYNPCWHAADANGPAFFHSVQSLYQTKQFWFNAINWVAPPNECNFTVKDPDVVVK
ncbi:MAG: hypothetical protein ACOY0T_07890 [Myxococcota bacterium]